MRLLVIGGTVFLGRHIVQSALERGHEVTLFNRGKHGADLFPGVERITGDRTQDLHLLAGREFDAVIDTCGYLPRDVRASTAALAESTSHYTFVSSISAYATFSAPSTTEDAPVGRFEDESVEEITGETYGPLKALCEQATLDAFPGRALVVRPGLIVGPHDPTDRFTYWPARAWRGGEVLAPGRPELGAQFIDVRDLADWMVEAVERKLTGTFNGVRPGGSLDFGTLLAACQEAALAAGGPESTLTWVPEDFLVTNEVAPWSELPIWVPSSDPNMAGAHNISAEKAKVAGMTFRDVAETVRDTLAWHLTRPADHQWRAGLTPEKEASVLAAWHASA
jgi:2'-hydroxyisoflavone reductase